MPVMKAVLMQVINNLNFNFVGALNETVAKCNVLCAVKGQIRGPPFKYYLREE